MRNCVIILYNAYELKKIVWHKNSNKKTGFTGILMLIFFTLNFMILFLCCFRNFCKTTTPESYYDFFCSESHLELKFLLCKILNMHQPFCRRCFDCFTALQNITSKCSRLTRFLGFMRPCALHSNLTETLKRRAQAYACRLRLCYALRNIILCGCHTWHTKSY